MIAPTAPARPAQQGPSPRSMVQFTHFERTFARFPGAPEPGGWAGLLGLSREQHAALLAECAAAVAELAAVLRGDPAAESALARLERLGSRPLVGLGSSITADRCGWFEVLRAAAPAPVAALMRNAGATGDTTVHALARLHADVLQHAPGLTVVALGVNDARRHGRAPGTPLSTPDGFRTRLAGIVTQVLATGSACVLATPTPVLPQAELERDGQAWSARDLDERADVVREVADDLHVPLADAHAAFLATPDVASLYLDDGLHPGPRGQLLLARTVLPVAAGAA